MYKLYFSIPFLLFFFSFQGVWKNYISEKGKFQILTPGEFTEKADTVITQIGTLVYYTYFHQPEDKDPDNLVYMVSFCDYPEGSVHSDSIEIIAEFFETTIETSVKSVEGSLFYSDEIQLGQYPGRLWRVNYKDGTAMIKTKAYLVNSRYYSIQTIALKDKSLNPSTDKFLDSFTLLE